MDWDHAGTIPDEILACGLAHKSRDEETVEGTTVSRVVGTHYTSLPPCSPSTTMFSYFCFKVEEICSLRFSHLASSRKRTCPLAISELVGIQSQTASSKSRPQCRYDIIQGRTNCSTRVKFLLSKYKVVVHRLRCSKVDTPEDCRYHNGQKYR